MAEEAQELTVTNAGQPQVVILTPAETIESAQRVVIEHPATKTVVLTPVSD